MGSKLSSSHVFAINFKSIYSQKKNVVGEGGGQIKEKPQEFPGGAVDKNPPANAGDEGPKIPQEDSTCRRAIRPVFHNY